MFVAMSMLARMSRFPAAVLVLPFDKIRLLYMSALIVCAPVPLKFTVLGAEEVVLNVPAVTVKELAIPKLELAESCSEVPFSVTLKRLAAPLRVEVEAKVAVPAEAEKLPLTLRPDVIVKFTSVVTDPVMARIPKLFVPAPDIVLDAPLIVSVPALAVSVPDTDKFPVSVNEVVVLTDPLTVRLSSDIPEPLMVVPLPVIVNVPPDA